MREPGKDVPAVTSQHAVHDFFYGAWPDHMAVDRIVHAIDEASCRGHEVTVDRRRAHAHSCVEITLHAWRSMPAHAPRETVQQIAPNVDAKSEEC